tara:strand:- start:3018 stop:3956 length:939 start_codon:yes stop_codon:yes gene_type:complete
MKQDPLSIILNKNFKFNKNFYFISGNEETLIQKIKKKIIESYQASENINLINIDTISDFVDSAGLFEDKKIYLVRDCKRIEEKNLNKIKNSNDVFIFKQVNTQKIKKIKTVFIKERDAYLIDCYELDKNSKKRVLDDFLKLSQINIGQDLYWFMVDKLDNRYGFLEDSLKKILMLDEKDITLDNIKRVLVVSDSGKERLFFSLLSQNKEIIRAYREKILNISDVNDLYYYCKFLCQLIIDSKNEDEYFKKIPTYLFKEKNFLMSMYRRYNSKKKRMLLRLLSSTENILRKESSLSLVLGLRLLLNIKRITVS